MSASDPNTDVEPATTSDPKPTSRRLRIEVAADPLRPLTNERCAQVQTSPELSGVERPMSAALTAHLLAASCNPEEVVITGSGLRDAAY